MSVFFNPAAACSAGIVPFALGGGSLGNSVMRYDSTLSQFEIGESTEKLVLAALTGTTGAMIGFNRNTKNGGIYSATGFGYQVTHRRSTTASGDTLAFEVYSPTGSQVTNAGIVVNGNGSALFGTQADSGNGRIQLSSHTAFGGGVAFGADNTGAETIWRDSSGILRTAGKLRSDAGFLLASTILLKKNGAGQLTVVDASTGVVTQGVVMHPTSDDGFRVVNVGSTSIPAGWGVPTGTMARTTFDSGTVTLAELAKRVAALIYDLHLAGAASVTGNGHGLLRT